MAEISNFRYETTYLVTFPTESRAEPKVELRIQEEEHLCSRYPEFPHPYYCNYIPTANQQTYTWIDKDNDKKFSEVDAFFVDGEAIEKEQLSYFQMALQESFELILQAEIDAAAD